MPYCKTTILEKAKAEYAKGHSIRDISQRYKVSYQTLRAWLISAGVKMRAPGQDRRKKFDAKSMVADYLKGDAVLALAHKYGVQRASIELHLREAGVRKRTRAEQAHINGLNTSPEEKARRVAFAHAAVRGVPHSQKRKEMAAIGRQWRAVMTDKEAFWREKLYQGGIVTVAQYAVGRWSVDLAVPDARVAIEIKSGWSFTGKKKTKDADKVRELEAAGWVVVQLSGAKWRDTWLEKIRPYVDSRRALVLK